ncbi:sulfur carrier protein ThiS adenylyltransferase ThiF [Clostridium sp. CCUG 7971]|uniref:sulfur carrier protein ThiS adenylyltransferase ThiF n=1 Tax=Clostridium sp. CCUG 7971 TaxID=2811414 RepID=UPI001ABB4670|nr:sulfur carrier protein ThiS adenylyltransferase ThiF [Clostridium sp. CCUG 7971]MBO3443542.1 sulfur carrier protein ThiS adenylyltransferase ThiF [Clostridium sp. CCUG 7971]
MKIFINEILQEINKNMTAYQVKKKYKEDSDVLILNGYQINEDILLKDNDKITLIKKGEKPSKEELKNLLIARHTPNIHSKLEQGKVAILGLGGLGSNIAISLARIGVGKLVLADFDVVEPSNLNRQQYFIDDIGKNKTDALKENIKRINPFINIKTHNIFITKDNVEYFNDVDIIIEAFDNPKYKAQICNYVLINMKDKYLIASSGMAGYYDSNIITTKKIRDKFYICGDFINEAKIGEGLMSPRVAICANHMANIATKILIEE